MKEMLFKSSQVVAALNHVDGFDPAEYARRIQKEGQADQLYLDVAIRKLWFRLKYPLGKIKKSVLSLNENMAAVEARIYLDKNDPEDQYIASGFSQKFRTLDEIFGDKFMETAETAAVGRALADAGFGIQFADVSGEQDGEQVDAGLEIGGNEVSPPGPDGFTQSMQNPTFVPEVPQTYAVPLQQPMYQGQYQPPQNQPLPGMEQHGQTNGPTGQQLDRRSPVEELYAQMNYDQAVKVLVQGNGKWTGKTLGQITVESPSTVAFFAGEGYKGPDNLVRVAARIILEKAQAA